MANILTTIIAWEAFQALATILIFLALTKVLNKWTKDDTEKKKQIKKGFTILVILIIVFTIISGFYRVSTYENVVLTKLNGNKLIIKDVGLHYSLLSTTQKIDLRNQFMTFPAGERFQESDMILTRDRIPIRVSGIFSYRIIDSEKWAIKINNPDQQLFYKINSIIIETVKQTNYEDLTINREIIEKEIFNKIEQQGIEKLSFKFIKTADSLDVISAKTKAEANEIRTKSMITQAESEALANKLLQESLKDYSPEQIEYLKTKLLSENINVKWVVPSGTSTMVGLEE